MANSRIVTIALGANLDWSGGIALNQNDLKQQTINTLKSQGWDIIDVTFALVDPAYLSYTIFIVARVLNQYSIEDIKASIIDSLHGWSYVTIAYVTETLPTPNANTKTPPPVKLVDTKTINQVMQSQNQQPSQTGTFSKLATDLQIPVAALGILAVVAAIAVLKPK